MPLDPASFETGVLVEPWDPAVGDYVSAEPGTVAIGRDPDEPTRLVVFPAVCWVPDARWRITLLPTLTDVFQRPIQLPPGEAEGVVALVTVEAEGPTLDVPHSFRFEFDSATAAADTFNGELPGGIGGLFQGLWTDPVTGLAYARARWYDARNASWLSEDPLLDVDSPNLYAFVGWGPHVGTDPMGLQMCPSCEAAARAPEAAKQETAQAIGSLYLRFMTGAAELSLNLQGAVREFKEDPRGFYLHTGEQLSQPSKFFQRQLDEVQQDPVEYARETAEAAKVLPGAVVERVKDITVEDVGEFSANAIFAWATGRVFHYFSELRAPSNTVSASAAEIRDQLPRPLQSKTVAVVGESQTLSGWAKRPPGFASVDPEDVLAVTEEIGHPVRGAGAFDQGVPGKYYACHAERQAVILEPNASVDVSSPMCKDCVGWFSDYAVASGESQLVSDPNVTRVFLPDGTIQEIPR
jgi:RHS repeat-associated protein